MIESIDIQLRRAATAVADTLDYATAAAKLGLTSRELRRQVAELERKLSLHIFQPGQRSLQLTDEGRFLVQLFRDTLALHERKQEESISQTGNDRDL